MDFAAKFEAGFAYSDFLEKYGTDEHRRRWREFHQIVKINEEQKAILSAFTREVKVVCLAGAWCGDCVNQCPIFDHFAQIAKSIKLRFVDRDADAELKEFLSICGGARVPVVVFLSEDDKFLGLYGDRTLSRYRKIAADQLGASCPTGLVLPTADQVSGVVHDWLNEFERIHWIVRTSARLREKHGD